MFTESMGCDTHNDLDKLWEKTSMDAVALYVYSCSLTANLSSRIFKPARTNRLQL